MHTPKWVCLMKLPFDVPKEYFSSTITTNVGQTTNSLWQIRVKKDDFIYAVSDGVDCHILTDEGMDFVKQKYVEHKL